MIPEDELWQMYWGQGMTISQIADEIGVCGFTVHSWMKKQGIDTRTISEAKLDSTHMFSKEVLEEMYCNQGMTMSQIGDEIGVSHMTVGNWMRRYGIDPRTRSESKIIGTGMISKDELRYMYWDKNMSQSEIADEIGVCRGTIINYMMQYEINVRTCSEAQLIETNIVPKEELVDMYLNLNMSQSEIANELCVSQAVVNKWMKKYGIESRTDSESLAGRFTGEKSWNWRGGISFEPYCHKFNRVFKEAVRERDDHTCQLCGYEQLSGGQKLDVHHIHYDKENCYPDVVALCRSCNIKVNFSRDYWEQYFENQLLGRGLLEWSISA